MLGEVIKDNRYSFHEGFEKWEDAIYASCQPLIDDGAIEESYIKAIIDNVNKYGPYIVIAPNICIPHAQEGIIGVNETAICFMKTEKPVKFGENEDKWAKLFFVLASVDSELHLQNLTKIVEILSDEDNVKCLLKATCVNNIK